MADDLFTAPHGLMARAPECAKPGKSPTWGPLNVTPTESYSLTTWSPGLLSSKEITTGAAETAMGMNIATIGTMLSAIPSRRGRTDPLLNFEANSRRVCPDEDGRSVSARASED